MVPRIVWAVFILSCLVLSSCGGSSTKPSIPLSSITDGNWSIVATSTASPAGVFTLGGSLVQSGSSVTGLLNQFSDSSCFSGTTVPFAGTLNGDSLTLTSSALAGQLVTINVIGSGGSFAGTYSVAGGCAGGDKGSITANYVPPLTGTWSGNLTNPDGTVLVNPSNGTVVTANLTLTQSPTATNGNFPLTGTIALGGGLACFTAGAIPGSGASARAYVTGNTVLISAGDAQGGPAKLFYVGQLTSTNVARISGRYFPGGCPVTALGNFVKMGS